jgi:site-specific DNA-methyltransferase (adenine-specific)
LSDLKWVSENVKSSGRQEKLSYNHHREVASLPPAKQELFLKKAVDEDLSVRELREEIKKETRNDNKRKQSDLPNKIYQVIYADPPWCYNDKCDDGAIQSGGVDKHYPTMELLEICELPINKLCSDNAVLFIWTTSPLLEDSFAVIRAWGFIYKASFVWDKIKHNMGHYNSVRHEFLLIATRGSCTPDNLKLFDSVQSIERTKHSTKPNEFYEIIETLYTGDKIELFARNSRDGWDSWGNEV